MADVGSVSKCVSVRCFKTIPLEVFQRINIEVL